MIYLNPKRLLTIVVLAAAASSAIAGEKAPITVAVFDFTCNFSTIIAKDITALVTADLSADPRFTLVERAQLNKALGEQALGLSGNVDFGAAARVGQLTGAKVLISGRAMKLKNQLLIVAN